MITWVQTAQVTEHLGIDRQTLRFLMHESDRAGIEPIWVNIGSGHREVWRWDFGAVDAWFQEVGRWRAEKKRPKARPRRAAAPDGKPERSLAERIAGLKTCAKDKP